MRTLEQKRAANALLQVENLSVKPDDRKLYRSYVDRLGPAIVMNGLGQALATELAAAGHQEKNRPSNNPHKVLYSNLQGWLCREDGGVYSSSRDLLKAITENDERRYLLAQVEALAWLEWHKKFCRATLPKGEEGGE